MCTVETNRQFIAACETACVRLVVTIKHGELKMIASLIVLQSINCINQMRVIVIYQAKWMNQEFAFICEAHNEPWL